MTSVTVDVKCVHGNYPSGTLQIEIILHSIKRSKLRFCGEYMNDPKAFFEAHPPTHKGEALLTWRKLLFH